MRQTAGKPHARRVCRRQQAAQSPRCRVGRAGRAGDAGWLSTSTGEQRADHLSCGNHVGGPRGALPLRRAVHTRHLVCWMWWAHHLVAMSSRCTTLQPPETKARARWQARVAGRRRAPLLTSSLAHRARTPGAPHTGSVASWRGCGPGRGSAGAEWSAHQHLKADDGAHKLLSLDRSCSAVVGIADGSKTLRFAVAGRHRTRMERPWEEKKPANGQDSPALF